MFRLEQFKKQLKVIAEHDEAYHGTTVGLNEHSDKSEYEWKKMLGLNKVPEGYKKREINEHKLLKNILQAPDKWDWRDQGAVTPVKN